MKLYCCNCKKETTHDLLRSYEACVIVNSNTGKIISKDYPSIYMDSEYLSERKICRVCGWIKDIDFNLESQID